jgi:hypothetical protein
MSIRAGLILARGTPIRHAALRHVTGVVQSHFFEDFEVWYVIDWVADGFAPNVKWDTVRELPSALHLLAAC